MQASPSWRSPFIIKHKSQGQKPPALLLAYPTHELTPSVVAMAVRMLIIMFITSFHVSFLFSGMAVAVF